MPVLLEIPGVVIREEHRSIQIRERAGAVYALAALLLLLGLGFLWLSGSGLFGLLDGAEGSGTRGFARWVAYIVIPCSLLLFAITAVRTARRPTTIDGLAARVLLPGKEIDFTRIRAVELTRTQLLDREHYGLSLETGDGTVRVLRFLPAEHLPALERIRDRVENLLGEVSAAVANDDGPQPIQVDEAEGRRFVALLLLALGVVWSVSAYLLAPDLVLGTRRSSLGIVLWPIGIWIALLGVSEWLRLPLTRWLTEPPWWRRALLAILWAGSLLLFAGVIAD